MAQTANVLTNLYLYIIQEVRIIKGVNTTREYETLANPVCRIDRTGRKNDFFIESAAPDTQHVSDAFLRQI